MFAPCALQVEETLAKREGQLQATQQQLDKVQKQAAQLEAELTEAEAQGVSSKANMQVGVPGRPPPLQGCALLVCGCIEQ